MRQNRSTVIGYTLKTMKRNVSDCSVCTPPTKQSFQKHFFTIRERKFIMQKITTKDVIITFLQGLVAFYTLYFLTVEMILLLGE